MANPATADEVLTASGVAAYLRCHVRKVYRLLKERQITAFKVGSEWRFRRSEIDQWIARQHRSWG